MSSSRFTGNGQTLVFMGGGGHAAVVADAARASGWRVAGFVSDTTPTELDGNLQLRAGLAWLGPAQELPHILNSLPNNACVFAAVGDGSLRATWIDHARAGGAKVASVVHPSAVLADSVTIDAGVFIGPQAVINARASIGLGAIVNTAAVIEHDCEIGPFAHVAPGSVLTGGVRLGSHAFVGARAVIVPERIVGDGAFIAAGSVVTRNVGPSTRVAGCPAKPISETPKGRKVERPKS